MSLLPIISALAILARLAARHLPQAGSATLAFRWKLVPAKRPRRRR